MVSARACVSVSGISACVLTAPLFCPRVVSVYVYDLSGGDKRRVVGFCAARPDYRLRTQDALGRLAVRQQGRVYRASVVPTDPGATKQTHITSFGSHTYTSGPDANRN